MTKRKQTSTLIIFALPPTVKYSQLIIIFGMKMNMKTLLRSKSWNWTVDGILTSIEKQRDLHRETNKHLQAAYFHQWHSLLLTELINMAKRNGFFACICIKDIRSLNIFPYLQKMSLIWRYFKSQCIFLKLEWVHIKTKKNPVATMI